MRPAFSLRAVSWASAAAQFFRLATRLSASGEFTLARKRPRLRASQVLLTRRQSWRHADLNATGARCANRSLHESPLEIQSESSISVLAPQAKRESIRADGPALRSRDNPGDGRVRRPFAGSDLVRSLSLLHFNGKDLILKPRSARQQCFHRSWKANVAA